MTDADLAKVCADLYAAKAPAAAGGVTYSVADGVICLRGSLVTEDWLRDFLAAPAWTPLGFLHLGFWLGMDEVFAAVKDVPNPIIVGHSLGAARAPILAGLFALAGLQVKELVMFAPPLPAFPNLRRVIEKARIPNRSYRFNNDPVPLVPFPVLPFMPWTHVGDLIALSGATDPDDLSPLRDHHIENYMAALMPLAKAA